MLFVLGIGSNIAMCSCLTTAILDQFPKWKPWIVVVCVATVGFLIGLLYITPVCRCLLILLSLLLGNLFSFYILTMFILPLPHELNNIDDIFPITLGWSICIEFGRLFRSFVHRFHPGHCRDSRSLLYLWYE